VGGAEAIISCDVFANDANDDCVFGVGVDGIIGNIDWVCDVGANVDPGVDEVDAGGVDAGVGAGVGVAVGAAVGAAVPSIA
jgi:hypothetical protein